MPSKKNQMKKSILIPLMTFVLGVPISNLNAQENDQRLNLPGDNLNLYAVLKLFQESPTLESFEKTLNDSDSKVNNLDLNNDNQVDYLKVIDHVDGDTHNIVIQDATSSTENQDVAVIVVQKIKDNQVQIQVIGDEDLYGKDYIIEPNFETDETETKSTPNPGYTAGGSQTIIVEKVTTRAIYDWPIVRVIYMPNYVVWISPWYWNYYPAFWHPWRPYYWHYYYGWHYHWNYYYWGHYRRWHQCRYESWNNFYFKQIRIISPTFIKIKAKGVFRNTYSRPDLMKKGSMEFKNKYPNSPGSKEKLPNKENIRTENSKPFIPRKENEGVRNNSEMNPNKTNQPKIRNNERRDNKTEQPEKNNKRRPKN